MIKVINVYKDSRILEMTPSSNIGLGVKTDNEVDLLRFTFDDYFEGTATLLTTLQDENGDNVAFPLTANSELNSYDLEVTQYLASQTDFTIQLEIVHTENTVWHSKQAMVRLDDCLNVGEGDMPTTIENWLTNANLVLEEMQEAVTEANNLNIEAEKENGKTTVTITHKDGTEQEVEILDGTSAIISGASATIDGNIGTPSVNVTMGGTDLDRTFTFSFSNLKGEKGDAGAIKMLIVNELPATGADDTIYLVPITPDTSGNNYAEYIYINGAWELLGKIGVQVDLTDYVKFTDYATSSKGGVVKLNNYYNIDINSSSGTVFCTISTYAQYQNKENNIFISKGTLENVITGKGLTTKTYVDGLVGDINSALDLINGEVI